MQGQSNSKGRSPYNSAPKEAPRFIVGLVGSIGTSTITLSPGHLAENQRWRTSDPQVTLNSARPGNAGLSHGP